jgi:transposase
MNKNQIYPTDLTDRQWDCIKDLVPAAKPGGRPRTLDMRAVINGIGLVCSSEAMIYIAMTRLMLRRLAAA